MTNEDNNSFLFKCIASIIFIVILYLPYDMYIVRFIGMIIFTVLYWKDQLKKLLFRHTKKNDTPKE